MAPINQYTTDKLRQLIYYNLDNNNLSNALFLAGRLHAYEPRASEAAYLVALCHLRLNQYKAAYDCSKNSGSRATHLGCAYVFAQACLGLGRYAEGIAALEKSRMHWISKNNWGKHTETKRQHVPDAAAVWCLLGKLLQAHEETKRAIECYAEALKANPFMWDAFTALCELGVNVRVPNVFKVTPELASSMGSNNTEDRSNSMVDESTTSSMSHSFSNDPFSVSTSRANGEVKQTASKSALFEKLNASTNLVTPVSTSNSQDTMETPSGPASVFGATVPRIREATAVTLDDSVAVEPPQAPTRKFRALAGLGMDVGDHAPPKMKASTLRSRSRIDRDPDEMDAASSSAATSVGLGITERKRTVSGHPAQVASTATLKDFSAHNPPDPMAPQRRSVRILNSITKPQSKFSTVSNLGNRDTRELKKLKPTGTKGGRANLSTVGRVVSGNRKNEPMDADAKSGNVNVSSHLSAPASRSQVNEKAKELESIQMLLDLFSRLGSGYLALSHYQCQEAFQIFNTITPSQRDTPWVLAQMARSLFQQASYAEAEKIYIRIRTMAPARLEDLELYSTCLWHLKKDVELSFLAHELVDINRLSPQAWCIVGNSFSLQRDHDQALKCFKRATHLDPKFAYAFTLQGHEHISNEEYDKAMGAYRSAIAAENRHYNAWYGLGKVYEKQGKYDVAEQHYRTAATINPTNAVLICCIGVVLEKMKKPQQALDQYTRSSELDPKSSLSRFKKARVLMALQRPDLALGELLVLKDIAPDEANVHFLLGRVYKTLRQKGNAIKHFTSALNLDPKASHHIKEAMEQMEDEVDEDELMT
ncbi:anaphase-promoting complex subunit cdc27 [Thelotrema lepadinum]|nr:anaphase-promoting complex subunit cdc27 [Thelotrema lepadinum]